MCPLRGGHSNPHYLEAAQKQKEAEKFYPCLHALEARDGELNMAMYQKREVLVIK